MVGLLWPSYSKLSRPIHKGTTHGRPEKLVTDPVKSNENGGFVFAAHFSSNFVAFSPARTGLLRIFPSPFEWVHLFDRFWIPIEFPAVSADGPFQCLFIGLVSVYCLPSQACPEVAILVGTVPELLFMGCSWLPSFSAG